MCCCGRPVVNGEMGFKWQPNDAPSVRAVNPPELLEGETLLYDEPGRCGGLDSHCHHYRVTLKYGSMFLVVRHGGGDQRFRLSCAETIKGPLAVLDSTARYWLLNAIYHAQSNSAREAREMEAAKWQRAAVEKRIRTRKQRGRGTVKVWIETAVQP